MSFKYAIALTGGIASGKSTFGKMLDGFEIIDLDIISHEILDLHAEKIAKMFGDEFVKGQKVDRKALGGLIFSDEKMKKNLEEFLHPLIKNEAIKKADELDKLKKAYFVDIPLFFEGDGSYDIKRSVLVYAPQNVQLKRLMKRSSLNELEAKKRINSQMDIEKKRPKADFVVENTKDLAHLKNEAVRLKQWIKDIK